MCKTPEDLDLNGIDTVAVDLETYDPNLKTKGSGALRGDGFVCGVAIATGKDTVYFNISHSDIDMSLDKKIKFTDMLDNNTEGIVGAYVNQMSGHVAFARVGLKSKNDYQKILDKIKEGYTIPEVAKKYSTKTVDFYQDPNLFSF